MTSAERQIKQYLIQKKSQKQIAAIFEEATRKLDGRAAREMSS
jgi:DNA-binding CsgD family transcriptional regulator